MEEQRIGNMYWNLVKSKIARVWYGIFGGDFRRSAALPVLILSALILLPSAAWYLHRLGKFSTLKREMKGEKQIVPVETVRPGGLEPIILRRGATPGETAPEFLSVTLLPGLGMDVLQITAFLPKLGETELLSSPTINAVADGSSGPHMGLYDTRGALEAPWGGLLFGLVSPVGTTMSSTWHDGSVEVPTQLPGRGSVDGGLLAEMAVDSTSVNKLRDGATATGESGATDFEGRWFSKNNLQVNVELEAHTIDLNITLKNLGTVPEPMGMGWHPRFAIPSGTREGVELMLPDGQRMEVVDHLKGVPSGKLLQVEPELARMQGRTAEIGVNTIDTTLVHLKPALMDNGASVEFRDSGSGYGLRMVSMSSSVRALHVLAPAGAGYVSLGMQTNYDDPFGKEWGAGEDAGIATLLPGQSMEWKVRLEIFPVTSRRAAVAR